MSCYTRALNEAPQANTHRVQKCLQKLLRSLHKDRHHTIQHFRHLLEMSFEQVQMFYINTMIIERSYRNKSKMSSTISKSNCLDIEG